ncbi:hypothetical protein [Lysobacter gummosus]|uniref:hypothetical protein n=1 Tax=Lysobacter gummosus TaxID=262324 RepID=UPI0036274CF7
MTGTSLSRMAFLVLDPSHDGSSGTRQRGITHCEDAFARSASTDDSGWHRTMTPDSMTILCPIRR